MATTEQITASQTITINPNSKNKTYEFGNEGIEITFKGAFTGDNGQAIYGYDDTRYNNFAIKKGDDLVLITLFTKDNGKTKKVTTTIKNFFADDTKNYSFKYQTHDPRFGINTLIIKPDTEYGTSGLYNVTGTENDYRTSYLLGTNGTDIFEFDDDYSNYVFEEKGNDEYLSRHTNKVDLVVDLAGNDKYLIDNYEVGVGGLLYTYDYAGKDEYAALGAYSRLYVTDYAGNDKYNLASSSSFGVNDYKGNDEYLIDNNDSASDVNNHKINDCKGNDKYYLTRATVTISDDAGKDYYNITNYNTVDINDTGKGNDTYDIKNCTDLEYGNFSLNNSLGNETYNLTNVTFTTASYNTAISEGNYAINDENGNDKYNILNSSCIAINDSNGKDKYNVTGGTNVKINDSAGKDTYNITGDIDPADINTGNPVNNIEIVDSGSENDKYNLQFVFNEYAEDDTESRSIVDFGGNDTYNLQSTSGIRINDKSGNDTYNLKAPTVNGKKINFEDEEQLASINIKTQIYDDSGNDKYNITHAFNSTIYDSDGEDVYNLKGDTIKINQEIAGEPFELTIPSVYITKINDTSTTSNDTYNIGNMANGELFVLGTAITDAGGDNKFNIKNSGNYFDIKAFYDRMMSGNATIADQLALMYTLPSLTIASTGAGKDKYSVSNSSLFLGITDANGDDSYSFKKVLGNISVQDAEGNDTYKISKNKSFISINDQSGDDAYTIDKLTYSLGLMEGNVIRIKDTSGYDTLKVSSLKESNIVYMANFSKIQDDNYIDNDFGLIIYDSKNGGFIELLDFYEITGANLTGFGDGVIENFKAGNKTIDLVNTDACNYALMESLREQVGGWLAANNYDDVEQVLTGNSQQAISDLIQIFQGINA